MISLSYLASKDDREEVSELEKEHLNERLVLD